MHAVQEQVWLAADSEQRACMRADALTLAYKGRSIHTYRKLERGVSTIKGGLSVMDIWHQKYNDC